MRIKSFTKFLSEAEPQETDSPDAEKDAAKDEKPLKGKIITDPHEEIPKDDVAIVSRGTNFIFVKHGLTEVPKSIRKFTNITGKVDLSENNLTNLFHIPKKISDLIIANNKKKFDISDFERYELVNDSGEHVNVLGLTKKDYLEIKDNKQKPPFQFGTLDLSGSIVTTKSKEIEEYLKTVADIKVFGDGTVSETEPE